MCWEIILQREKCEKPVNLGALILCTWLACDMKSDTWMGDLLKLNMAVWAQLKV